MEKKIDGNNILIISHIGDIDGMGSVILTNLAFDKCDYLLVEQNQQQEILDFLKNTNYKQVYICDLGIDLEIGTEIDKLNKNILLFDHHKSHIEINKYNFAKVEVYYDNKRTSGTHLYYHYLLENNL